MNSPIKKHDGRLTPIIPLVLIGLGLIVIGIVLFNVISKPISGKEYSVVPAAVSFAAPAITLDDVKGNTIRLSDYQQQIVLVNNWATWCPPCRSEMPTLQKYYQEHVDQGFVLIGINEGDPLNEVTAFIEKYLITFPILLDPNNKSMLLFNNDALPSSYVIDHTGTVVLAWTGPISHAMLEKYVTPLLEE